MPLLDYDAGGYENGLSRERDPYTLQHHSKEDKQASVLTNQGENLVYGGHVVVILLLPYNHTARGRLLGTDMTPLDARDFLSKRQGIAAIHSVAEKESSRKPSLFIRFPHALLAPRHRGTLPPSCRSCRVRIGRCFLPPCPPGWSALRG